MLFDSPVYFLFLTFVVLTYWRLRHRSQNVFLLLASYFFYGWWDWRFLALMIVSTTVDFLIAGKVAPGGSDAGRKRWLIASLTFNFAILGIFKYFNFFVDSFADAMLMLGIHEVPMPLIRVLLPPGISFYTFQEVAYIVDVYKGRIEPAEKFVDYGLFISLFPHLIAGPIQRPGHLLPQVQSPRRPDADRAFDGLLLIFSGLLRKCVIADNCAFLANAAFNGQFGPPDFWIVLVGTYAFAWQIYGDFSGYSDIARGSAQLLGFHFMVNFRQPYLSQSIQEFWRRWHISLSTWLRDYLYIPLGGSADGPRKTYRNLLITMILAGLWHGAAWTFVIFGALHGVGLAVERFFAGKSPNETDMATPGFSGFFAPWGRRIAIFHFWCLTMVFFRAPSLRAAMDFLGGLTTFTWRPEYAGALVMLCAFALPLFAIDLILEASEQEYPFARTSYVLRTGLAVATLPALALFSGNDLNVFIYFRF
jgi:D-alanyl-lipoteichoic acid acyltransferase DltB (MBOAT superfamily)